ncbi:MAG: nucleotidyltransferase domain-containing protein [Myxococcales bacterium]|nr:nucleotidyltransferase domain-containing protein [Myxococcales bacterium]
MSRPVVSRLGELLAGRGDVKLGLLFGSYATGRETPESDVDVAVSGPADRLALAAELGAALGVEVQVVALEAATVPLLQELVDTSVVVHEASPGAGATWRARALCQLETDGPWYRRMRDAWLARVAREGL